MKLDLPTKDLRTTSYPLLVRPRMKRRAEDDPFKDLLKRAPTTFIHSRNLARSSHGYDSNLSSEAANKTMAAVEAIKLSSQGRLLGISNLFGQLRTASFGKNLVNSPNLLLPLAGMESLTPHGINSGKISDNIPEIFLLAKSVLATAAKEEKIQVYQSGPLSLAPQVSEVKSPSKSKENEQVNLNRTADIPADVPENTNNEADKALPPDIKPLADPPIDRVKLPAKFLPKSPEKLKKPPTLSASRSPSSTRPIVATINAEKLKSSVVIEVLSRQLLVSPDAVDNGGSTESTATAHGTIPVDPMSTTTNEPDMEEDLDKVSLEVLEDMLRLEETFPVLSTEYRLIDKIGEGTFSTVFKAEAMGKTFTWGSNVWATPPKRASSAADVSKTKHPLVALKQIYVTSSPVRIHNELNLLYILLGNRHVAPLLDILRQQDQVVVILPYYPHSDFRDIYRDLPIAGIKKYLWEMFSALEFVHLKNVIHRDLKPTNFLYDPWKGRGVLVDFGLAEKYVSVKNNLCGCMQPGDKIPRRQRNVKAYPKQDQRPPRRANRAGTRGFRAPEVLFKCANQTTKIDIWLAGIIGLSLLARKFPLFNSPDDTDALVEMALVFGVDRLQRGAELHGCGFQMSFSKLPKLGGNLCKVLYDFLEYENSQGCFPEDLVALDTLKLYNGRGDKLVRPVEASEQRNYEDHKHLIQLLGVSLQMDPAKRGLAKELKKMPFFDDLHKVEDDIIYD